MDFVQANLVNTPMPANIDRIFSMVGGVVKVGKGWRSRANFRNILVYSTNGKAARGHPKQVLNLIYGRN